MRWLIQNYCLTADRMTTLCCVVLGVLDNDGADIVIGIESDRCDDFVRAVLPVVQDESAMAETVLLEKHNFQTAGAATTRGDQIRLRPGDGIVIDRETSRRQTSRTIHSPTRSSVPTWRTVRRPC